MFSNNKYVNKFYSIVSSSIQTNNVTSTNGLFRPEVFVDTVKLDSFEIFPEETSK